MGVLTFINIDFRQRIKNNLKFKFLNKSFFFFLNKSEVSFHEYITAFLKPGVEKYRPLQKSFSER